MDSDKMRVGLKKIEGRVKEMTALAEELGERLERAENLVRRLGWCPWCEKRLRPRGKTPMGGHDPKLCRCPQSEDTK